MDQAGVALYHRVMRRENFEKAAKDLVSLVYAAEKKEPGKPRTLYLDIDGHRNAQGRFEQVSVKGKLHRRNTIRRVSYGSSFPTDF